jgi:virulence-associated protein VapD
MATQRRYKAINFDLDTGRLRQVFGEKNRRKAYAQIKSFLAKNGFAHKQWSGYISLRPMSYGDVYDIVFKMIDQCPWLPACVNQFDATNVMSETDMMDAILHYGETRNTYTGSGIADVIDDSDLAM